MKPKILISESQDFLESVITDLKSWAELDIREVNSEELTEIFLNYDVFWFRLAHRITRDSLPEQPRCKIIATPVTGIDHIDEQACAEKGIKIVCLRGEREFLNGIRATAEHTIALTLALFRNIPAANHNANSGLWERDLFRGNELFEKTVGIIGMGRLGCIVADYFKAFGCRVVGYDIRYDFPNDKAEKMTTMETLAQESDIVSIHVNLNDTTEKLINQTFFNSLKRTIWFVNTSRGGIVDENAMAEALVSGKLKGAALDVVQNEHLFDDDNHLLKLKKAGYNILLTPHIGGNTFESFQKTESFIAAKIKSLLN